MIALLMMNRHQSQASEKHRLVDGVQRQLIFSFIKIELIGVDRVAHLVLAVGLLPAEYFFLGRAHIVTLVVFAHFAGVSPQAVEAEGGRA